MRRRSWRRLVPGISSFARSLEQDLDAVTSGAPRRTDIPARACDPSRHAERRRRPRTAPPGIQRRGRLLPPPAPDLGLADDEALEVTGAVAVASAGGAIARRAA